MISGWSFNSWCVQIPQDGLFVFYKLVVFCYQLLLSAVDAFKYLIMWTKSRAQNSMSVFVLVAIMQKILLGVPPEGRMNSAASGNQDCLLGRDRTPQQCQTSWTRCWDVAQITSKDLIPPYSVCINIHRYRLGPLSPPTVFYRYYTAGSSVDNGKFLNFSPPMIICFHI